MVSTDAAAVTGLFGYWSIGGGTFTVNGTPYNVDGAGVYNNDFWADGGLEVGGLDLRPVAGINTLTDLVIANVAGGALISFGADSILLGGLTAAQVDTSDFLL